MAWLCTNCGYSYDLIADTLMVKIGRETYKEDLKKRCSKCDLKLVRVYRHINPKNGKQLWVSLGWYCERCKYLWMDEEK